MSDDRDLALFLAGQIMGLLASEKIIKFDEAVRSMRNARKHGPHGCSFEVVHDGHRVKITIEETSPPEPEAVHHWYGKVRCE